MLPEKEGSLRLFRGAGVIITIIITTIIITTSLKWVKSCYGAEVSGSSQHVRKFGGGSLFFFFLQSPTHNITVVMCQDKRLDL